MTEMKNNIRQHPNGTWEGRYYDVDGKQHSLYGRTKAIVKDKLASKRAEIVSGNSITETDLTIEQWGLGVDADIQSRENQALNNGQLRK